MTRGSIVVLDVRDLANQLVPDRHRQEVLDTAFWTAADLIRSQPQTREDLVRRINGLVDTFLEMGFTADEIRQAVAQRVSPV